MKKTILLLFIIFTSICYSQENCDNGIDDDGDGKIDLNDNDCICNNSAITSIIPNPSFEQYSDCPTKYSQLYLATPWIQASEATSDYYNKCDLIAPGIKTAGLDNFPDGNGIVGAIFKRYYQEYLGSKLLSPMKAGIKYQLTFNIAAFSSNSNYELTNEIYEPVNITLFGNENANNLPIQTKFGPTTYDPTWVELGNVNYTLSPNWGELTISFTPTTDINAIILGAPNVLPLSYPWNGSGTFPYFLFDNLLLNTSASFGINITQTGNFCDNNLVLKSSLTTTTSSTKKYQWYHNGIAILGATNDSYMVSSIEANLGQYSVKLTEPNNCLISRNITINNVISNPNFTVVQPNCSNPTGTINITTAGSEYSFDNGATWQSSSSKSSLSIGNYRIKVKTSNGCISSSIGITILSPRVLNNPEVTVTQPTTCDTKGTITINSSIASQYSFDNGLTWTTTPTKSNLEPGNYVIKIKDVLDCESLGLYTSIYPKYLQNPDFNIIQPSCGKSGQITITTIADYYSFDNGLTWTVNPIASNLEKGNYSLKIKNKDGCESNTAYVNIENYRIPIYPSYSYSQPTCQTGGTITITSEASEFSFDGGKTWLKDPIATNLLPGIYEIVFKNELDCISYSRYVNLDYFYLPNPEFTTINPTCETGGTIKITTSAKEYSFDNGVSWTTDPVFDYLVPGQYKIKIKNSVGCESAGITIQLNAPTNFPSKPTYNVTQPNCNNYKGIITINTEASEFSFDNGNTWTNSKISVLLNSGDYFLKIKTANGCISDANKATIIPFVNLLPKPTITNPQTFCIQQNTTLNNIAITGQNIKWYDALTNGNLLPNTTVLQNGITYYASQTINGCESERIAVLVNIQNTPVPTGDSNQSFCSTQHATLNDIEITGTNIKWYNNSNLELANTTLISNNTTYYATQTINNCESVNKLSINTTLINTLNANNYTAEFCDDNIDGKETINLSLYNQELIVNSTANIFSYYSSLLAAENQTSSSKINNFNNYILTVGSHTLFVRIDSPNGCHQVVALNLNLYSKPIIPIDNIMPICEGSSITINAGTGYDNYLWSTGETSPTITIKNPGDYSVTVTNDYDLISCSTTKDFTVKKSTVATINSIETQDWTDNQNTIKVFVTGEGDFEYSIDGIHFQDSNEFSNVISGQYNVLVRDKNGCGTVTDEVYLLMYPKFFTPNGDGYNDTWKIKFSDTEKNLTIKIFDRYGKLLKELLPGASWNGQFNNQELPATDYWFIVTRANGKEYKGHFSLKR